MNYLGVFKGKLLSHVLEICVGHADNNVFFVILGHLASILYCQM